MPNTAIKGRTDSRERWPPSALNATRFSGCSAFSPFPSFSLFVSDASGLVAALAQFAHLAADAIVNGSATSHLAPTDHADKLTESCRDCGQHSLDYLKKLKDKQSLREADPAELRTTLQRLFQLGQELRPKSLDIREEELGDLVDKEMATTSAAVEDAVRRIEEMMNQARVETSGVKLEVNERILNSCTDLMKVS
ncbi:PREDICTED: huntingtin-interacting protein 1-related protein-like [Thamnophis sirtalis]|uniref:Huntingtin-interacting protein 1-related protein-like n=1 Tax=Thamnophis sirtalis TaxID=35019 RepID=A0A6I9YMV5_9SAUR|nr:PREDICTED: huntingtin-interacting protein 1-related protein-like [Thamnophis sirtalis]